MASRVPDALVPTRFVRIDAIPMTRHGKVDRGALPDEVVGPLTVARAVLRTNWRGGPWAYEGAEPYHPADRAAVEGLVAIAVAVERGAIVEVN